VSLLDAFKSKQQSFELVFPRKGPLDTHPQHMDGCIEEAFASALGALTLRGFVIDHGVYPMSLLLLVAKKGGLALATQATNTRKARKSLPSPTTMALS
jgi:hypothetical protein